MIKIKFSVLVILFLDPSVCLTKYCDICPEHTLCKYAVSGPSPQCVGYDTNAFLTEDDIGAILDKINDRRHFIATGRSRFLPAAANMKKIVWSKELATFAQRWVDQCDQSLKPDRKDKCRDLDDSEVGQSIVTITGSSSYEKLRVQSMVEVWFMESMDYTGSVTYYNQSREQKTNYFTQLIWADTDKVGCGKARFFVKTAKPIIIDRLVCNFAPKGNLHGKPVYTIGYAATHNRKRSVAEEEEENFKPFWQMDEYVNRNQPKLKSMRYTTLSNKNNLKNKRTRKQPKTTMKTESITVTFKDRSNNGKRITEKYLSFDELMHLRKHNAEVSGGRRYNDDKQILRESNTSTQTTSETTTTESPSTEDTPEYSFNTPYNRMRHCTRKLTCTWTAASLTDSAGSIIPGGGANAVGGSRTPPGYVEGCTRTSTCTRDYMNRNKMATLPVETTNPEPEPGDDEDYCERRSLNRRSNNNLNTINSIHLHCIIMF
ncbi:uncharacterized protein LOC112053559 [Bicyclus anynana]|uniref:Uncharacterized protein LOC112053559 n=1 Tax=Bicyclus anynana TaxID=110368 RepID=A0ABM3LNW3_BICAN|nr:uncharacterized protein LOC112053559 [Bicyclus anynana]